MNHPGSKYLRCRISEVETSADLLRVTRRGVLCLKRACYRLKTDTEPLTRWGIHWNWKSELGGLPLRSWKKEEFVDVRS